MTTEEVEKAGWEYVNKSIDETTEIPKNTSEIKMFAVEDFMKGAEFVNKHWLEKQKANIENLFSDQNFINNLCFSFRHDYGLLDSNERDIIKFECSEWLRAIINNWKEIE